MANTPYNQDQANQLNYLMWGFRVDRATALPPQGVSAAIFTITGGRVIVNLIVGEVTTVIGSVANATKLIAVPSAGSNVDLCATSDINALQVGGKLIPAGVFATALGMTNSGAGVSTLNPMVIAIGSINLSCVGSSVTGAIKWSAWWTPFDDGALLVAA